MTTPASTEERILLVDDEENILNAYRRVLRSRFALEVANGGAAALQICATQGPFAVIVSDMRMPGMSGVELLETMHREHPDTVRMMLTGNADQQTATEAVNRGAIFRFLRKPCQPDELAQAITVALEQHRLLQLEKNLLESTLLGLVRTLGQVISLVNPPAFGRAMRIKDQARAIAAQLGCERLWEIETAALLSQLGCVVLPPAAVEMLARGDTPAGDSAQLALTHPLLGSDLLADIPRLEGVAASIRYQHKGYDGSGFPDEAVAGEALPLGARILNVLLDYDRCMVRGLPPPAALSELQAAPRRYDPAVLAALAERITAAPEAVRREVRFVELNDTMVLDEDLLTPQGMPLVCRGQVVTVQLRDKLARFREHGMIREPIAVLVYESAPACQSRPPLRASA
ncbi:MAG: response regulator [Gammaproteobacteria bacterium]|nr:response regulator [Gammaproteobacteria bacterium]